MHRYKAEESFQIGYPGEYTPVGAYLAYPDIIRIAKSRGAGLIHPGYGFLAENANFARAVEEAGMSFVGPSPEVIDALGDKTKARKIAIAASVSVVPGSDGPVIKVEDAVAFAKKHGMPLIIKAAMGGGGRGMRVVNDLESLPHLFERAVAEATSAFGDGTVFLERFLVKPRHIEVQLLGDSQGNVVHLFERDCSIQRRHQKVVEMAPAASLNNTTLQNILNDAIKIAKHVKYRNAGTAEFLVDQQDRHYFIEINPRIQVEHTVTEEITGIDIVGAQIEIAKGKSLLELGLFPQEKIVLRGFAIQTRVTTEDPSRGFQPDTGKIEVYRSSGGNGVRLDGGPGFSGAVITPHYDSLLVKCTVKGSDFENARKKTIRSLSEFRVRGIKTNIPFLLRLLSYPDFIKEQKLWTTFIDDTPHLLQGLQNLNRGQKLLKYLGDLVVNGTRVLGQQGLPQLQADIILPKLDSIPPEISLTTSAEFGWRNILLEKGPEGLCRAVRAHKGVLIMDTTWRDAHQSLLATRVRTVDLANIATTTSHGFQNAFALECWGGATFDVAMRFLWECPWERLKTLRKLVPNIPFQMLLRGANAVGYTNYPDNVVYDFCEKAKIAGVDIFRIFDSLNYVENLKIGIDAVKKAGGVAEATISYTGDITDLTKTKYTLEYYLDLAEKLVKEGIHILGIKDMAGLLKPRAATMLIGAIRKRWPDLVIHLHTHDTAGTGVATYLAAAEAGVDIIDTAIDALSGMTSQPCMGAVVSALHGTPLATGIKMKDIQSINGYWEQMRLLYSCFDPGLKACDSGVYDTEIPGGQYTNLMFQAQSLGLGTLWEDIKRSYIEANQLCGDIVKVTPSSKVVGDLAQFMVSSKLTAKQVEEQCETLNFPVSVIEYFRGFLGEPSFGYLEPMRSKILKSRNLEPIDGRPGKNLSPINLDEKKLDLEEKYGSDIFGKQINEYDVLSSVLYPKVFEDFMNFKSEYGEISSLPTRYFLTPLKVGEEFTFELETGKTLIIQLMAVGRAMEDSKKRDVYFLLNGEARVVQVIDEEKGKDVDKSANAAPKRPKADPKDKKQVGAPMAGLVVDLRAKVGMSVKKGTPIAILSAMKMETVVSSAISGVISEIFISQNENVSSGDLIAKIEDK
ncbi:pyruvate carboxylase [Clydaea vesicula]|uniref:Pyruvate carboxylase n=1 Tax=Clydaea vesicula TaxID=447962 RepID=A0AAD5XVB9_9FUNG|nr:pyruvate carboxylase [Clydaea vesicula]